MSDLRSRIRAAPRSRRASRFDSDARQRASWPSCSAEAAARSLDGTGRRRADVDHRAASSRRATRTRSGRSRCRCARAGSPSRGRPAPRSIEDFHATASATSSRSAIPRRRSRSSTWRARGALPAARARQPAGSPRRRARPRRWPGARSCFADRRAGSTRRGPSVRGHAGRTSRSRARPSSNRRSPRSSSIPGAAARARPHGGGLVGRRSEREHDHDCTQPDSMRRRRRWRSSPAASRASSRKMANTLFRTGALGRAQHRARLLLRHPDRRLPSCWRRPRACPIHVLRGPDLMARGDARTASRRSAAATPSCTTRPITATRTPPTTTILVPVIDDDGVHRFTVLAKAHQADCGNSHARRPTWATRATSTRKAR